MSLKERAKKLKTDIPAIFLALKDRETPKVAKIFAGITVAYALSPIDLIPDFIPILGYLDDVILLPALVALTIKFIPPEILEKNRKLSVSLLLSEHILLTSLLSCEHNSSVPCRPLAFFLCGLNLAPSTLFFKPVL